MKSLSFILFLASLLASCKPSPTLSESEQTMVRNEIAHTLDRYYEDILRYGLLAEFKYLDSSDDFFWVPPGYTTAIGYDSVSAVLKRNAAAYQTIDNRYDTLQIRPLSRELATYTGQIQSRMTDTLGRASTFSLIETGVLIKRKDGWKLLSGQTAVLPRDTGLISPFYKRKKQMPKL